MYTLVFDYGERIFVKYTLDPTKEQSKAGWAPEGCNQIKHFIVFIVFNSLHHACNSVWFFSST